MALAPVGIQVVATNVNSFLAAVNSMNRQMHLFGATARTVSKSSGGMTTSIRQFGSEITKLGNQITRAGLSLSFLATAPLAIGFAAATQAAINFERELVKLNTLASLPSEQIGQLSDEILGLGNSISTTGLAVELGIPPVQAAEAAYFILSKSSRDLATAQDLVAHTQEVLAVSAKGAAIGLGDIQTVAGALTSIISAYGQENLTAARAGDLLVAAIDRGAFEADELAGAVGKTLGIIVNMGVSFEEATAFVSTFSLVGTTASESLTGLRRVLLSILKPSEGAKEAFELIGSSAEQMRASVQERGLLNTLQELDKRLRAVGLGAESVFTRETGLNAFLLLTGQLSDEYVDNLEAIAGANGKLEASFGAVRETTGFQLAQLSAGLQVMGITISRVFLPAINLAIQRILPFISAIADWAAQNPRLVLIAGVLALITAVIGPLLIGIGFLIGAIGSIVSAFGTLLAIVGTILSPIGLLVAAILALGAALATGLLAGLQQLRSTNEQVAGFFDNLGQNALAWGQNIVIQLARGIIQGAVFVVRALVQLGNVIASWLAPGSPPALLPDLPIWGQSAMQEWIDGFALADFSLFSTISDTISQFLRSTAEQNDATLIPTILGIREALAEVISRVREMGDVSTEAIAEMVAGLNLGNSSLEAYVTALLAVAEASEQVAQIQQEIADINAEFDSIIDPLNEEMQALRDREREIERNNELGQIAEALQDPDLTPQERELLLIRQRQLELEEQIATQEELRDEAVSAAEEALAAAEEELAALQEDADLQQELINLQIDHNGLLAEQVALLASVADGLAGAAGAVGGLSGGLEDIGDALEGIDAFDPEKIFGGEGVLEGLPEFDLADLIGEETITNAENLISTLSGIFDPLEEDINSLRLAWENLGLAWGPVVSSIIDGTVFDTAETELADFGTAFKTNLSDNLAAIPGLIPAFSGATYQVRLDIEGIGTSIDTFLANEGTEFKAFFEEDLPKVMQAGETVLELFIRDFLKIVGFFSTGLNITVTAATSLVRGLVELVLNQVDLATDFVLSLAKLFAGIVNGDFKATLEAIGEIISTGLKAVVQLFADLLVIIPRMMEAILTLAVVATDGKVKEFFAAGRNIADAIGDGIEQGAEAIVEFVDSFISGLVQKINDFLWNMPGGGGVYTPYPDGQPGDSNGQPPPSGGGGSGGSGGTMPGTMFVRSIPAPLATQQTVAMAPANGPITMNFNTQIMSGSARDEAWFRQIVRQEVAAAIGRR